MKTPYPANQPSDEGRSTGAPSDTSDQQPSPHQSDLLTRASHLNRQIDAHLQRNTERSGTGAA